MYFYHVIGTLAIFHLTFCFCYGESGKPEHPKDTFPETMMSRQKVFGDMNAEEIFARGKGHEVD